jgi:hypothetical protein
MPQKNIRLQRERKTIQVMIRLYCRRLHHPVEDLCPECQELADYAMQRIDRCPFKENKPTCANCTVHCYKPAMRQQVRQVMRYSGPRMLLYHPFLALMHFMDGVTEKKST